MAGSKKLVAVFLVCMVVLSAMNVVLKVEADKESKFYKDCFDKCQSACMKGGKGYTDCEMNCDSDCTKKETAEEVKEIDG